MADHSFALIQVPLSTRDRARLQPLTILSPIRLAKIMIFSHRSDLIAVDSSVTRSETLRVMLDETALGNMFAFSCLYDELATETYTFCLRIVATREQADQAVVETWLRVWQHAASLTRALSPARETILAVAFNVSKWVKSNG